MNFRQDSDGEKPGGKPGFSVIRAATQERKRINIGINQFTCCGSPLQALPPIL
uniref:Uncharacterized protein n=1 Tax=Vibrio splendidus TaxID=29497 RepID=A0A0H3ZNC2_VIBSP|nr:hypothetical protein [Vibrio splendidus]